MVLKITSKKHEDGKMIEGGRRYDSFDEAIKRYNELADEFHGEFASKNP